MPSRYDPLDRLLKRLALAVRRDEPLRHHGTWRIGGPADRLVEPSQADQIEQLVRCAHENRIPWIALGKGSNLLFSDAGLRGLVIKLGRRFARVTLRGRHLIAQSGVSVPRLAHQTALAGLSGLEHTVGIPCTLGGLVTLNGGSLRQDIGRLVDSVLWIDPAGQRHTTPGAACEFSYRHSGFLFRRALICEVHLTLEPSDSHRVRRAMLQTLRQRRQRFPLRFPNCGSVFKRHPELFPRWGPPGRIIEDLGLKGLRAGDAEISHQHANFFLNRGRAKAGDILALIDRVRRDAYRASGVWMECEVIFVSELGRMMPAHQALPEKVEPLDDCREAPSSC